MLSLHHSQGCDAIFIYSKRILREIKLLRHFTHENVIALKDILKPASLDDFEDVYIISDLMNNYLFISLFSSSRFHFIFIFTTFLLIASI